jgi:RimJ/RimL family protein N-acetyltransferase
MKGEAAMDGKLVRLRGYELSDLDLVMQWINDEEITQYLGGQMTSFPISSVAERKFIETVAMADSPTNKTFAIETIAENRFIGALSFNGIDWINRHSPIGIMIGDKSYWGRGYGTDAMRVLLRLGFDTLGLHRIWLHVYDYNPRAIACYEKCGFRREGVMRQQRFVRGEYHDTIVMGILESEYRAGQ